jgi:hypothetical protein
MPMTSRSWRRSGGRLAAAALGCSVLVGAAIGPALASSGHGTGAGTDGWSLARSHHLRAETVGADGDELAELDALIDPEGAADDGTDEGEAGDESEPTEKPEATRPPLPVSQAEEEPADDTGDQAGNDDDQGENEQGDEEDGDHDDVDSGSEHDSPEATDDSGEHDGGDAGETGGD